MTDRQFLANGEEIVSDETGAHAGSPRSYALTFAQPHDTPSENEARRMTFGSRGGAIGFHKKLKAWQEAAFYAWKQQRSGPVGHVLGQRCQVQVEIQFRQNRTRDPHNYVGTIVKSVVDGLVLANVWPDDNPEWVEVLEPILTVIPAAPQTALVCIIHLTPLGR